MYSTIARCMETMILLFIMKATCEIPNYIEVCRRNNPELAACIINSINGLAPYLKNGIPELDVPALEPLRLNNIQLELGSTEAKMSTNLSNIQIWGASQFQLISLRVDISSNTFHYQVTVPKLKLESHYEVDTKILFLNVKGKGPLDINITDYNFNCSMKGNKIEKKDDLYLEFEKMSCTIAIGGGKIHLSNMFNGNALLENTTNTAINENVDIFFREIKPTLTSALEELFTTVANRITLSFTYDELFPQ